MARSRKVNLSPKIPATSALTRQQQKPNTYKPREHLSWQQTTPVPAARAAAKKSKTAGRTVDTRLKGADLYVARLAWKRPQNCEARHTIQNNTARSRLVSLVIQFKSVRSLYNRVSALANGIAV